MPEGTPKTLPYKRSHFATQLPLDYLYSASHAWIARQDERIWRVGLTKFATRMLGEIVDFGFDAAPATAVKEGQIVGWIEGFKAISDLFCIAKGEFLGANQGLKEELELITRDPYGQGWLYAISGQPDPRCVDVYVYRDLLDQTIDRLLAKDKTEGNE